MKKMLILLLLFIILIIPGCNNDFFKEADKTFNFKKDKNLDKYLNKDKEIIDELKNNPYGATGPKIAYANERYVLILNYNGILIYDFKLDKIVNAIDNLSLGMNKIQGSEITRVNGFDKYVIIYNEELGKLNDNDKVYIYNIEEDELGELIDKSIINFEIDNYDEYSQDIQKIKEKYDNTHTSVYPIEDGYIMLIGCIKDRNWTLNLLDSETFNIKKQYNLFEDI